MPFLKGRCPKGIPFPFMKGYTFPFKRVHSLSAFRISVTLSFAFPCERGLSKRIPFLSVKRVVMPRARAFRAAGHAYAIDAQSPGNFVRAPPTYFSSLSLPAQYLSLLDTFDHFPFLVCQGGYSAAAASVCKIDPGNGF